MSFNFSTMAVISSYKISQIYKNEYSSWLDDRNLNAAKRKEYLRRNPEAIKDYDLQRVNILLNTVEMMDKSLKENSNKIDIAFETATNLGLGYAAIGGAGLGFLITKLNPIKRIIKKLAEKTPKSKNIISMSISIISGVLGVLAAYPAYNFLSKIESKIHRKRKFDTIEKELQDPKIFVVLDDEQKKIFNKNLPELDKALIKNNPNKNIKKEITSLKNIYNETLFYDREQSKFRDKYKENTSLYEKKLSEKDIKNAKKDQVLLTHMMKEINTKSQSYTEKMERITDNLITFSFALGSLFTLGYERLAKKMNLKSSSLPAGLGVSLLVASTFFANWAQRRAAHVGRFKAIEELKTNPEQLIYISSKKTSSIEDEDIKLEKKHRTNTLKFLKDFFKHNKEYKNWKVTPNYTGKDISKAMENIEISPEQIKDGKRLQKNLFKTLYKVDKNSQKYSSEIDVLSESIKYPITLILGTIGSVWGLKHLANLRNANASKEILKHSAKYIGIISLFTIPTLFVNSYFAKTQKMGARISDMETMKDLEDYRFFADYS